MYLDKFDSLMARFPAEEHAIQQLGKLFFAEGDDGREFPVDRVFEATGFSSRYAFERVIAELVRAGTLKEILRVESRSNSGGVKDYDSLFEIPPQIHDWRTDTTFQVEPDDIKLIYRSRPNERAEA